MFAHYSRFYTFFVEFSDSQRNRRKTFPTNFNPNLEQTYYLEKSSLSKLDILVDLLIYKLLTLSSVVSSIRTQSNPILVDVLKVLVIYMFAGADCDEAN